MVASLPSPVCLRQLGAAGIALTYRANKSTADWKGARLTEDEILERLAQVHEAEKSFDHAPSWDHVPDRMSIVLTCRVSLRADPNYRAWRSAVVQWQG
jgi:hypothetical protein